MDDSRQKILGWDWSCRVSALTGWQARGVLFAAGFIATLAMPPVYGFPLLWIAFPILFWRLEAAPNLKAAFATGWWFGFGHFLLGFYWLGHAFMVDPWRLAWMIPFAVGLMGAGIAIFVALAAAFAWKFSSPGWPRLLALVGWWTLFEWLRSWIFTGLPWNPLGHAFFISDAMLQAAALFGVFGLTLLVLLIALLPGLLSAPHVVRFGLPLLLLGLLWGGGALRLSQAEVKMVPNVYLRLVQGNVAQTLKWKADLREAHFVKHLDLSLAPSLTPHTHVIWPETAVPFLIDWDPVNRARLAEIVPKGGLVLTGSIRATAPGERPFQVWNSFQAVDENGELVATYDKFHLVPFGEYMPFNEIIPLKKLTVGGTDFSAGPGPRTLNLPGLPPLSPLVCYEVIFPGEVVDPKHRPAWLLNVTNDGWYGISFGPYQHLASSRMRSIEEGLPLVRANNTGISVVTDAYGRVIASLGLGETGHLDSHLPEGLSAPTPFAKLGNLCILAVALLITLSGAFGKVVAGQSVKRRN